MRIFTNFEPSLPIQSYRGFWHQKSSVGQPFVTAATLKRIAFFTWKQSPTKWLTYFRIFFFCQKYFFFFFNLLFEMMGPQMLVPKGIGTSIFVPIQSLFMAQLIWGQFSICRWKGVQWGRDFPASLETIFPRKNNAQDVLFYLGFVQSTQRF